MGEYEEGYGDLWRKVVHTLQRVRWLVKENGTYGTSGEMWCHLWVFFYYFIGVEGYVYGLCVWVDVYGLCVWVELRKMFVFMPVFGKKF